MRRRTAYVPAMTALFPFDSSYARLPDRLWAPATPTPVTAPSLLALNRPLAVEMGLDPDALASDAGIAALAGNRVPDGATPLAQAYAGHQFGGFVPTLGDGRAILLGEVKTAAGRRDVQLKGAGPTPFSRFPDGRAWIGPVLREYVVSEAMAALGIPTTRALAAVSTGDPVVREEGPLPGAVLTRVASSHLRIGTFQYVAAREDRDGLDALVAFAIDRHYPDADGALGLFRAVAERQARLVARWLGVGFVHGVMNTDNTSISGETIDYGPCAFLDGYHPERVFSSIDRGGRYAFARQPQILSWNLAQLASALLPAMGGEAALDAAQAELERFAELFQAAWLDVHRAKLGLAGAEDGDADLIHRLLDVMAAEEADFTRVFRGLTDGNAEAEFADPAPFRDWAAAWRDRTGDAPDRAAMARANPAVIPRNHRVQEMIDAAVAGDLDTLARLTDRLSRPFETVADDPYALPPTAEERVTRTFCGT